jgi:hypothetical protein
MSAPKGNQNGRKPAAEARRRRVNVRLSEGERRNWELAARRAATLGEWVRRVGNEAAEEELTP